MISFQQISFNRDLQGVNQVLCPDADTMQKYSLYPLLFNNILRFQQIEKKEHF